MASNYDLTGLWSIIKCNNVGDLGVEPVQDYLKKNETFWSKDYVAENVECWVFRPYEYIFKFELGLTGERNEKVLDFGCGQGTTLGYFRGKGFDVYGVDINSNSIDQCKEKMPDLAGHFGVISPVPTEEDQFFDGGFDLVTSIQTLYYLSDTDLKTRLTSLYNQMKPNAVFYATMMGTKSQFYKHSREAEDGLSLVELDYSRFSVRDYYLNFTKSEEELVSKFGMFEKIHVGYYDFSFREDEGSNFHYTYIGKKK